MSRGFIKVTAKGNIGQLEAGNLPSGDLVVNFSLASTSSYTDNNGQKIENTTWVKGVGYRRTAELMNTLLQKGSEIFLEGKLSVKKWQDQQGNNRETTEVIVDSFELLSRGKARENTQQGAQGYNNQNGQQAPQGNYHRPRAVNQPPQQHYQQPPQTGHGFDDPNFANG
jgi:single-strand DNA-binding protein